MQFKAFDLGGKQKFLQKKQGIKQKKEDDSKRINNVILLQKTIRAFLCFCNNGGKQMQILIPKPQAERHINTISQYWENNKTFNCLLAKKMIILTLELQKIGYQINKFEEKIIKTVILLCDRGMLLNPEHIRQISNEFLLPIPQQFFQKMMIEQSVFGVIQDKFTSAFQLFKVIKLFTNSQLILKCIKMYVKRKNNKDNMEIQQSYDLERLTQNYKWILNFYQKNQNSSLDDCELMLIVIYEMMGQLQRVYIDFIQKKYMISSQLLKHQTLRQQVMEVIKEKSQWSYFEVLMNSFANKIQNIIQKFIFSNLDKQYGIVYLILQKIMESIQINLNVKISFEQFEKLVDKLSYGEINPKQNKKLQFICILSILERFFEEINDLEFQKLFHYREKTLESIVKKILNFIVFIINQQDHNHKEQKNIALLTKHLKQCLSNLYNKIFRTKIISTAVFVNENLFNRLNKGSEGNKNSKTFVSIYKFPYLVELEQRFYYFRKILRKQRQDSWSHSSEKIRIRRNHQFQDAFNQLSKSSITRRLHVTFINQFNIQQVGIDAGGLSKQFLTRVVKDAFNPNFGLFIENEKKQLMPHPMHESLREGKVAEQYQFIGKLIGKALFENIMLGPKFSGAFLNLLVNKRNNFDELLYIDKGMYQSLASILHMQDGFEDLFLTFEFYDSIRNKKISLRPNGHKIQVTNQNKIEFVNLLTNYKVNKIFEAQTRFIRRGLRQVIDQNLFLMFNYQELNYLISGSGTIDVQDWKKNTIVKKNNEEDAILISNFWKVVESFSEDEKSMLLKFVTSCERPSYLGFKDLSPPFSIVLMENDKSFPLSHTCSNLLELPRYKNYQNMRDKILYAIKSATSFEIG